MRTRMSAILALVCVSLFLCAPSVRAEEEGKAGRASLGVIVKPTPQNAEHPGVIIREAPANSPAARAGMKTGDVIVKVGDRDVKDFDTLVNILAQHKPGDKLTFHVMRDGQEKTLTATLGKRTERTTAAPQPSPRERRSAFLGIQMQDMTPAAKNRFNVTVNQGALVTEVIPGTPAEKAGLKEGDVITSVDDKQITNPQQLREAIREAGPAKEVTIKVVRGKDAKELKATLEETPADVFFRQPFDMPPDLAPRGAMRPPMLDELHRLEQQVERLERRVRELEQKLGKQPSK